MELCRLSEPLVWVSDKPLVYLMIYGMNPVQFFTFLSGYGLYVSYVYGKNDNTKRVLRLYFHYWLTLVIFVTVGYFVVGGARYPGTIYNVLANLSGWQVSYNHEIWFLFPYACLALTSKFLFSILDRVGNIMCFFLFLTIYVLVRFMSRYDVELLETSRLYFQAESYLTLLFPFVLGAISARSIDMDKIKKLSCKGGIMMLLFTSIILLRNCYHSIFYPFYVMSFSLLFVSINKLRWISSFLVSMGKRATSIWFIHTYFCYYLFQNLIYSFRYPILIFIFLTLVSYLCALLIDYLNGRIQQILLK